MKISIVSNHSEKSEIASAKLKRLIAKTRIELDEKKPDIVVSIGGDGTLLSAFHRYAHILNDVRFVGVHTGHLGFYTDWRDYELEELVESLLQDDGTKVSYPLIDVRVNFYDRQEPQHLLSLNECTIKRINRTMVADVYIKNERFERYRGDGLSVSTPTGSTAYNKSIGGAIINPQINALQLAELAPLNNRIFRSLGSPLIISNDEWIKIDLEEAEDYLLSVDQLSIPQSSIEDICLKVADEKIHFTSYRHTHFWRRVKDAFIAESSEREEES